MIRSFADKETKKVFNRQYSKKLPDDMQKRARRKLQMIKRSQDVNDLRVPPGNRLKKMKTGPCEGRWSIRINQQWRICFAWQDGDAYNVEIIDYHD